MIIVIFGAGSHGKVVYGILKRLGYNNDEIKFVDIFDKKFESYQRCEVIGGITSGIDFPESKFKSILSYAGNPKTGNQLRQDLTGRIESIAKSKYYSGHAQVIDPSVISTENVTIGKNVSVGINSILNNDTLIGNGVIINNDVLVEHDVIIGDYVNISPSVKIMGNVEISNRVFIGAGAVLRNNIRIGKDTIIGMGSVVTKDIPANSIVMGPSASIIEKK